MKILLKIIKVNSLFSKNFGISEHCLVYTSSNILGKLININSNLIETRYLVRFLCKLKIFQFAQLKKIFRVLIIILLVLRRFCTFRSFPFLYFYIIR